MASSLLLSPVFPLPDTVFFPKTLLPLHVFEPRYRLMIADAIRGNQPLCVALLKPGWEADYEGSPEVHPVACVGNIVMHEDLGDGRFNIVLQGVERVMIEHYQQLTPYRVARLRPLASDAAWTEAPDVGRESAELLETFRRVQQDRAASVDFSSALEADTSPEAILNSIAMYLDVEPQAKQFLLEIDSIGARYRSVVKILNQALTNQDRIDHARHLEPEDPRRN